MNRDTTLENNKIRLIAALLLLVFAIIPLVQGFHHHSQTSIGFKKSVGSASFTDAASYDAKCAVCDYLLHKESKYRPEYSFTNFEPKRLLVSSLTKYEIVLYAIKARLFPLANSPPVG